LYKVIHCAQDTFWSMPGLQASSDCDGVTGRWGLLSHAVRWLMLSRRLVEAAQNHYLFVQLSFFEDLVTV